VQGYGGSRSESRRGFSWLPWTYPTTGNTIFSSMVMNLDFPVSYSLCTLQSPRFLVILFISQSSSRLVVMNLSLEHEKMLVLC